MFVHFFPRSTATPHVLLIYFIFSPLCLPFPHLQATATSSAPPAWDECGWHYAADAASGGPATAQYIMVLDALNFCFWPSSTSMEYDTLAIVLRDQLTADPEAFSAAALSRMQASTLTAWFKAAGHDLPNAAERAKKLREVGTVLAADFGGSVAELVARAKGSAVALVGLVTRHFPGFRDEAVYKGQQVFFYKRAQIFVAVSCWRRARGVGATVKQPRRAASPHHSPLSLSLSSLFSRFFSSCRTSGQPTVSRPLALPPTLSLTSAALPASLITASLSC